MTTTRVSMQIDDVRARRAMAALLAASVNPAPAMTEIGATLLASTQARFGSDESPDDEAWAPLAVSTQLAKVTRRRARGAQHILVNKGALRRSLTYLASAIGLDVGSPLEKSAILQMGGTPGMQPGPAAIPARPYLGLSPQDESDVGDILIKHMAAAVPS